MAVTAALKLRRGPYLERGHQAALAVCVQKVVEEGLQGGRSRERRAGLCGAVGVDVQAGLQSLSEQKQSWMRICQGDGGDTRWQN